MEERYPVALIPNGYTDISLDHHSGYVPAQTVHTPAISIWCVRSTKNGDIIAGGSDHTVYIFTTDLSRSAPADEVAVRPPGLAPTEPSKDLTCRQTGI